MEIVSASPFTPSQIATFFARLDDLPAGTTLRTKDVLSWVSSEAHADSLRAAIFRGVRLVDERAGDSASKRGRLRLAFGLGLRRSQLA